MLTDVISELSLYSFFFFLRFMQHIFYSSVMESDCLVGI